MSSTDNETEELLKIMNNNFNKIISHERKPTFFDGYNEGYRDGYREAVKQITAGLGYTIKDADKDRIRQNLSFTD